MGIDNSISLPFVFPEFREIEKRKSSYSNVGPYAEVSLQIFAKLRSVDLCRARLVCKEWKQLIQQANLWKDLHPERVEITSLEEKPQVSEIYVGCMITGNQAEKLYLYIKGGFLKGYLYRKEKLIEEISPHQIQGGLHGEIESQALIRLANEVEQPGLFALYHPQAADKKVILLPAPPAGSYLEEYALSYIEAPLPHTNLFCRPNFSKALEKGLKKFGLVSLMNEEGAYCPTGKTELAKAYFYAQRKSCSQALWLRGEREWFIEKGLQEFSQEVGMEWQEWLGTHSHWLIIIDGLSHISLLRKLGLIELARKKQGKLIVTTRDKAHDSAIHQIPVGLLSREESKNYLLQATYQKGKHSAEEAEKIGLALGGVPSSLKKAADWLNDNAWPLKVYFAKQAANLAEHKAYLEARSNLTPPNEYFTGREADLVALEETLTQGKPLVLAAQVGLGGVGKTQLALQYAYRAAPQYNFIWWLNAASEAALLQSYSSLAEKLHIFLTKEEEKEDKALVKKVHCYLKENPGWLLIFDDAENATDLNSWLPESGGHLLITSRKPNWPNAHVFPVGVFKREESIELILKITHLEDQKEEAGKLADLLQNLPLAVSQAAFYIKETHISIEEYREKFEQHYKVLWEFEVPPDIYQATVQVTWHVSMQKIRQEEAKQKETNESSSLVDPLMQFCAYLSSQGIPRRLLKDWVIKLYESETPLLDINHTIDLLRRYSMIEANAEAINIHSLVQLVTRDQLKKEEQKELCRKHVCFLNQVFKYHARDLTKVKSDLVLIPHVESITNHARALEVEENGVLNLKQATGDYFYYQGAYEESKKNWEFCSLQDIVNRNTPIRLVIKYKLACSLIKLEQHFQALHHLLQILKVIEKDTAFPPFFVMLIFESLGIISRKQGFYHLALETHQSILLMAQKGIEIEPLLLANIYEGLGLSLQKLEHYHEAKENYEKALEIQLKHYTEHHPNLAITYVNLGTVLRDLGDYDSAEKQFKKAIKIYKKVYPKDHPALAEVYLNLGVALRDQKKYTFSKKKYKKALKIYTTSSPNSHLLGDIYNNLGDLFIKLGKNDKAEVYFRKTLYCFQNQPFSSRYDLITAHSNLGCMAKDDLIAKKHFKEAIEISENFQLAPTIQIAAVRNNLIGALIRLNQYAEAEEQIKQQQAICQTKNVQDSPLWTDVRNHLTIFLKFIEFIKNDENKQSQADGLEILYFFYLLEEISNTFTEKFYEFHNLIENAMRDWQEGNIKGAKQKYKESFKLFTNQPYFYDREVASPSYQNLGCYYHIQQKLIKAEIYLNIASHLNPSSVTYVELGYFYYVNNNYAKAIENLLEALRYRNQKSQLYYGKLEIQVVDKDIRAKIEQEGNFTVEASKLAYKLLVNCYTHLEQLEKAQHILKQFTEDMLREPLNDSTQYLFECAIEAMSELDPKGL
ncbi:FxSxx-COOH system tetratricopeptide repeat protein [Neochlamydia sp. AcF95]|uniref:FxSxx-COOH system tetratricopeptide repeat protein n=1 Tax=Neochlamydia sp. AcF95 TaxID=2795734 RepID=UPI001BC9C0E0|nr:FxSxx-COOH system tetratricopeptide repeat protein [Neochlamydia sp. AcF95]MBS4169438.1 hypothetical protein [Neochlamydia sp. AcF95]